MPGSGWAWAPAPPSWGEFLPGDSGITAPRKSEATDVFPFPFQKAIYFAGFTGAPENGLFIGFWGGFHGERAQQFDKASFQFGDGGVCAFLTAPWRRHSWDMERVKARTTFGIMPASNPCFSSLRSLRFLRQMASLGVTLFKIVRPTFVGLV